MTCEKNEKALHPEPGPETLLTLKDQVLDAWGQLPPEHQATIALVLLDTVMQGEWGLWAREAVNTFWPPFSDLGERPGAETLDPHHFYAAYVFDYAEGRDEDLQKLTEQAQRLGYPLRHWWLSDAMELEGAPDRLILCAHHPSSAEDAGLDLYEALTQEGAAWDYLEAAAVQEYRFLGKPVQDLWDIRLPNGSLLFPDAISEINRSARSEDALLSIMQEDVREELQERLGRDLSQDELTAVLAKFKKALDWLDWTSYLDEAIQTCQDAGQVGPSVGHSPEENHLNSPGT